MSPRKPRRWRKDFPYYKVQIYNEILNSWVDEREAYPSLAEARQLIKTRFSSRRVRIMVVEREGRHVLQTYDSA
jgi:hypothetical protein